MIYEVTSFECSRIAQDLQIRKLQVEAVVQLFNEGNTVPFITRYRKERTGALDEDVIRAIQSRLNFLKHLNERKQTMLKSIETQGRLTDELRREILHAPTVRRLEDLYLPFKPKKKSLALAAREKGLEPLALAIWHSDQAVANLEELLPSLVNPEKQLNSIADVQTGVQHILAEMMNETAEIRAEVRRLLWKAGTLTAAKSDKVPEGHGNEFKPYFQFKESTQDIRPHRILALNRGEKEGVLKVKLEWPAEPVMQTALAVLADHLLRVAGKPPQPSAPTSVPEAAPEMPPAPPLTELPSVESPPSIPPTAEAPSVEAPPPIEAPAAEIPPIESPPALPASPLVESLSTEVKPALTGEPLAPGIDFRSPHAAFLKACLDDALNRLMLPTLERDIRHELTDEAELHAVKVFAHNIRSLLMQPPLVGKRVLAIDPGFRTGCKLAALDESGNLLEHTVIYPHGGPWEKKKGRDKKPQEKPAAAPAAAPSGEQPTQASEPSEGSSVIPSQMIQSMEVLQHQVIALQERIEAELEKNPVLKDAAPAPAPDTPALTPEVAATTTPDPEMGHVEPPALAPVADAPGSPESVPAPIAEAPASPEPPVDKAAEAKAKLVEFAKKHNLSIVAIGNGTACRETEAVIADVIGTSLPELAYVVVSEAGASVYSVSPTAKEEFPNLDATIRSGASIGRRLQDPLSELVKIDPQSLGVGLYQHDMGRRELKEALEGVVESCVNQVGVDVNTASVALLRYVSGLNQMVAREIVEHRKNQGPFTSREQLQGIPGIGPTRYTQCAGFLKVTTSANPLDRTRIHPESYPIAEKVIGELGHTPSVLDDKTTHGEFRNKLNNVNVEELAQRLEVGVPTLDDIFHALARPGRDPRVDMPPPIFKKGILKVEDLQPGMELKGTVLNVVDFGAFVDVGLKDSGLVHISQMANKYIKSPYDVVSVNDIVTVWVMKIDKDSNHVSLSMIRPGSERKPLERGQRPPRREGEGQAPQDRAQRPPPRAPRPDGPPREGQGQRQGDRPQGDRRGPPQRDRRGPPRERPREEAPPPPQPPPRKPRRETPPPKLTKAAMEGKAPLRTLGELAAFFAAKEAKDQPPPAPPVEEKKETPPESKPPESASGEQSPS